MKVITHPLPHTHTHTECHLGTDDLRILLHVSKRCQWQPPVCHYREGYTTVHSHTIYGYMVGRDLKSQHGLTRPPEVLGRHKYMRR